MKVKVIKVNQKYNKKYIGKIFEVVEVETKYYKLLIDGVHKYFEKDKCEVVEDVEKSCKSCKYDRYNTLNDMYCDKYAGLCDKYSKWQPIEQAEENSCYNCKYDLLSDEHPCNKCSPSRDMWKPIGQVEEVIAGVGQDAPTINSEIGSTYTATHYMIGNQQPIEIMQSLMSEEMLQGFLWGNVIKYSLRLNRKGKMREDAGKCLQYATWLCDVMDGKKIVPGGK